MTGSINITSDYLLKVAKKFGYVLNPNEKSLGLITSYLDKNKQSFGKYYCPCKQHHPVDVKQDPICPCSTFKDEIEKNGFCECHVFFEEEAAEKARKSAGLLSTVTCPG
jgi:ferredoxin-thioredoxin reductase catalytic subunit